jgi:protein tyrosine/serine phosphatase
MNRVCFSPSRPFFLAAAATLAALIPRPTSAQTSAIGPDKDIPNFARVAPGIYRGAAPTARGLARLKAMGVRTIIDLRIEKKGQAEEAQAAQQLGLTRLRLPMGREAPTAKQVKTFLGTLNDPAKGPVFVHCQHGADRTGAMVGIYRVTHDGWDFPRTYAEMRRYGFKPFLHELKGAVSSRAPRQR